MSIEFPSAEMEMESQALREIVEKEEEFEVDFSALPKKLVTVLYYAFSGCTLF